MRLINRHRVDQGFSPALVVTYTRRYQIVSRMGDETYLHRHAPFSTEADVREYIEAHFAGVWSDQPTHL